jgi:hypothetical protein
VSLVEAVLQLAALLLHDLELTHVARLLRVEMARLADDVVLLLVVDLLLALTDLLHDLGALTQAVQEDDDHTHQQDSAGHGHTRHQAHVGAA